MGGRRGEGRERRVGGCMGGSRRSRSRRRSRKVRVEEREGERVERQIE
jgi:hypothetical protein